MSCLLCRSAESAGRTLVSSSESTGPERRRHGKEKSYFTQISFALHLSMDLSEILLKKRDNNIFGGS